MSEWHTSVRSGSLGSASVVSKAVRGAPCRRIGAHRHRQIACLVPGPSHTSHLVTAAYFCQLLFQSAIQATVVHWQLQFGLFNEKHGLSTTLKLLAEHTHEVSALLTIQAG